MSKETRRRPRFRSVVDLMRRDITTISPDATVAELARLLRSRALTGIPVVDAEGAAIGTVSVTDLLWLSDQVRPTPSALRTGDRWEGLGGKTVREVMTPDVFGVSPEASIEDLLEFFARTGLHRAMVLEAGKVVGIVSATDLLGLIADEVPASQLTR
jgi:CBS-domain-containing membrane protein